MISVIAAHIKALATTDLDRTTTTRSVGHPEFGELISSSAITVSEIEVHDCLLQMTRRSKEETA